MVRYRTPLLNLRWYLRTFRPSYGRVRALVDVTFAGTFFLARIYLIYHILAAYGAQHSQSAWTAFTELRVWCQLGTASMWAANWLWWSTLVRRLGSSVSVGRRVK